MSGKLAHRRRDSSPKLGAGGWARKNAVLVERGRAPWYRSDGTTLDAYIIGIAGGSASGKTRVSSEILKQLDVPWVLCISQDSFYKPLSKEQSKQAFLNNYDFDAPDAFDYDLLRQTIKDLKAGRAVQSPNYSFTAHQRTDKTTYLYGASVVIVEGIFVLDDKETRDLFDLKVFVQCDSDLMLARRLRRDLLERGRDAAGILDQYLRFVKPSFDNFISPTAKFADVQIRGQENEKSIRLISSHIRQELDQRKLDLRSELFRNHVPAELSGSLVVESLESGFSNVTVGTGPGTGARERAASGGAEINRRTSAGSTIHDELPDTVLLMEQTPQLVGIHTRLRDQTTTSQEFIFLADRLSTLVVELALSLLPYSAKHIETRGTAVQHLGVALAAQSLVGVSILRSGSSLEKGLRRVVRDIPIGSVLIQSEEVTGEPLLYSVSLPRSITLSQSSAEGTWVLLLDAQIGTGAAALMAVRVLLDHGVREDRIVFCTILVSRNGGVRALEKAFPKLKVVTSAVDDGLEELWLDGIDEEGKSKRKKVFAIIPGLGSFGARYFGVS